MAAYTFQTASGTKEWQVGAGQQVNVSGIAATWGSSYLIVKAYQDGAWYQHPAGSAYHTANFSYTFDVNSAGKLQAAWYYGGTAGEKVSVDVTERKTQTR